MLGKSIPTKSCSWNRSFTFTSNALKYEALFWQQSLDLWYKVTQLAGCLLWYFWNKFFWVKAFPMVKLLFQTYLVTIKKKCLIKITKVKQKCNLHFNQWQIFDIWHFLLSQALFLPIFFKKKHPRTCCSFEVYVAKSKVKIPHTGDTESLARCG